MIILRYRHFHFFNPYVKLLIILLSRKFWILTPLCSVYTHPCLHVKNISNLIGRFFLFKKSRQFWLTDSFEIVNAVHRWPGLLRSSYYKHTCLRARLMILFVFVVFFCIYLVQAFYFCFVKCFSERESIKLVIALFCFAFCMLFVNALCKIACLFACLLPMLLHLVCIPFACAHFYSIFTHQ